MSEPIMAIFDTCAFLTAPGPFEYFFRKWVFSENQRYLDNGALSPQIQFWAKVGR